MKAIAKFLMPALALAAVGILGTASHASAQEDRSVFGGVRVGDQPACPFIGTLAITAAGQDFAGTVNGSGTFQVTSVSNFNPDDPTSVNSVSLTPFAIQAESDLPGFGKITTTLQPVADADLPVSSTSSLNAGPAPFPARGDMTYNATGTIGDVVYTSRGTVSFVSDNISAAFPFTQQAFRIARPVEFVDADGNVGFVLNRLDATFR